MKRRSRDGSTPSDIWDDRERDGEMNGDRKVILVGLDGATFDLLGPWIDQGILPNQIGRAHV